jgi:hypothetical protein
MYCIIVCLFICAAVPQESQNGMGIQNSEKFNGVVVTFPPVKCEFLKS